MGVCEYIEIMRWYFLKITKYAYSLLQEVLSILWIHLRDRKLKRNIEKLINVFRGVCDLVEKVVAF